MKTFNEKRSNASKETLKYFIPRELCIEKFVERYKHHTEIFRRKIEDIFSDEFKGDRFSENLENFNNKMEDAFDEFINNFQQKYKIIYLKVDLEDPDPFTQY